MSPKRVALALVEPARGGFVEVQNGAGEDVYLWVAVDGFWPPVAREEQHLLRSGSRRRFGPGLKFEAIAQTVREGDEAFGSTLETLVPGAGYRIVASKGALDFAPTGTHPVPHTVRRGHPVGQILIARQVISQEDLNEALTVQSAQKRPLGEILVELGILSEKKLRENISEQLGIPFLELSEEFADPDIVKTVAGKFCKDNKVLPLYRIHNRLVVAMVDPTDLEAIDALQFLTGYKVDPVLVTSEDFQRTLDHFHTMSSAPEYDETIRDLEAQEMEFMDKGAEEEEGPVFLSEASMRDQTPVIKLVNLVLKQALSEGASEIVLEPADTCLRVRNRVHGALVERDAIPRLYKNACLARVKVLAKLDITEQLSPQDGQFTVVHQGQRFDVHVSTCPAENGETVVLRLPRRDAPKLDVPFLELTAQFTDPEVASYFPSKFCDEHRLIPLYRINERLVVAMVDPTDLNAIDALQHLTGFRVDPVLVTGEGFRRTLDTLRPQ